MKLKVSVLSACAALGACATTQGGEIFIFDYVVVPAANEAAEDDIVARFTAGAPIADLMPPSQTVCRAAFSGAEAPDLQRAGNFGQSGFNITVFDVTPVNVSSLDTCADSFADLNAAFGPTLALNTPTARTSFDLAVGGTPFTSVALSTTATGWNASTVTIFGDFEVVATSAPAGTQSDVARELLLVSEGRFVLR